MSLLAEFAAELHEKHSSTRQSTPILEPVDYTSKSEVLYDVRAVIFDVYGTLINYWRPGIDNREARPAFFKEAFRKVSDSYGFTRFLAEMDPDAPPENTLYDLYHGLIALSHEKSIKSGIEYPEVKIEDVWGLLLLMLKRRGYDPAEYLPNNPNDFSRYCAFSYNFFSLGRTLYPEVVTTLSQLKKAPFELGVLSNGQFYTGMDLTLMIRDQSSGAFDDLCEIFNPDLTFFSCEYGVAKPNPLLFRKLYDALYEFHILPEQTVFVGNDLALDIEPAEKIGMKTAFFAGDRTSAYFHGKQGEVIPDIIFQSWDELPRKLSFFSKGTSDQ